MNLNTVKLNVFSFTLEKGMGDCAAIKEVLKNAIPYNNLYLQGNAFRMNDCLYYFEVCANGNTKLHIMTRWKKYPDEKAMQKKDALIAAIRGPQRFDNVKFGKTEALWPQWQKVPGHILALYLRNKKDECYA